MKNTSLQEKMFEELKDLSLFQKAVTYGVDHVSSALERNVYPTDEALSKLSEFEEALPIHSGDAHAIVEMLHQYGAPATVTHVGGRYFGFVTGGVVPAGLAAKNLSIFWDQNSAMEVMSPISSKLETVVQKWLIEIFGFPSNTVAGFVSGTSMANFCGLAAGRYRVLKNQGWDINEQGLWHAPKVRIVTGRHAHSTILKAISLLGFGKENIEWIDCDAQGRIIPEQIPPLDDSTILILQAGNVNSGSFDDFSRICKKVKDQDAWIHVDGAFGLWAGASEKLKHLTTGFEYANSWAVDGHKTLNTPYDSGIILCDDAAAISGALHMTGGYIVKGEERDGMYFTPEMSRRSRIIELWATIKYLGKTGIDELVYGLHEKAQQFARLIEKSKHFKVLNDVVFNQVIVQCENVAHTEKVMQEVQRLRTCWAGGSTWMGQKVIRVSVCSWTTTEADIVRSVDSFNKAAENIDLQA